VVHKLISSNLETNVGKDKGKVYSRRGQEGPEGEWGHSCTLSLTSALDGMGGQRYAPVVFLPVERPGTHCIRGWVGPRTGQDGSGISHPIWIRSLDRPAQASRYTD